MLKSDQTHPASQTQRSRTSRRKKGFTLMEILLVMALLGGLVILGVMNVGKILGEGQADTVRIFVNDTMKASLFRYRIDNGRYPTTEEGLSALVTQPATAKNWKGPYMDEMPKDPWGQEYQYRFPGKNNTDKYDVFSFGMDGVESGDDIGNW